MRSTKLNVSERSHVCRTVWSKASDDQILQYKQSLHDNLQNIQCDYELLTCSDTKCTKHLPVLSSVYGEILCACIKASDSCIPTVSLAPPLILECPLVVIYLVGLSMLRSYVGNLFTSITTGKILVGLISAVARYR